MLASFLFSLLAGFLTVHVEGPLKALIDGTEALDLKFDPLEMRVLTFGLLLLLAAIATALAGRDSSAYLATSGGLLGYFGSDLFRFLRDPDRQTTDENDWDGDVSDATPRHRVADHADPSGADAEETMAAVRAAMQAETSPEEETKT